MAITMNKKVAFISVLMGILILGITLKWIYEPKAGEVKGLLKTLDEEYEKNRLIFEINKTKEEVERRIANELLKTEKDLSWVLGKISERFKTLNLELISLEPLPLERGIYYTRMPVKVKTLCNYHDLGELISRLENLDKFIDIGLMDIKPLREVKDKKEKDVQKPSSNIQIDNRGFVILEVTLSINSLYPNY